MAALPACKWLVHGGGVAADAAGEEAGREVCRARAGLLWGSEKGKEAQDAQLNSAEL